LWGEFFSSAHNDQFRGRVHRYPATELGALIEPESVYIIRRPVFVLPMITLHVGHVLVDLLEQVFDFSILF
jgi:hypothetical protein